MPDGHGNLTVAELRRKLDAKQSRRRRLDNQLDRVRQGIKKLHRRIRTQKKKEAKAEGPAKAVKWARAQQGTTESPPNSNWGPKIGDWIKWLGYTGPVPWCGCFVGNAVIRYGGANIASRVRLGYVPSIYADAKGRRNGLTAVSTSAAKAGDIVCLFGNAHTELVSGQVSGGYVPTIGGNTSSSNTGSQNNGGGVFARQRAVSDVTVVARPNY